MRYSKTLNDWLAHIESFHPSEISLGLDRITQVAKRLEIEREKLASHIIIVGGTNGKGSCVAMLESLALSDNKSVISYTSPHLILFNERIKINGDLIADDKLLYAFESIERSRGEIPLTFFEFTTLAALWIAKQTQPDYLILEVGLGGRLDAVNIINPDISIITTIDLDHSDWLGDSLEQVAKEKSGISRSNQVTLVGDSQSLDLLNQHSVVDKAKYRPAAPLNSELLNIVNDRSQNPYCLLAQNLQLAYDAYQILNKHEILDVGGSEALFKRALYNIRLQGRFQSIKSIPHCIVDVAHNPQAARNLANQINQYCQIHNLKTVSAICGMMKDKAINEVLSALNSHINHWHFVDLPVERALKSWELKSFLAGQDMSVSVASYQSVVEAAKEVIGSRQADELILVFGSFITVGEMIQYVESK